MIQFRDFSFQYKDSKTFAVKHVSLEIQNGDFIGITGESGAGKTTLLSAINGVVPHHYTGDFYGEVLVCGQDTLEAAPEALSQYCGSVFQDIDGQMVSSVVEDEILFGLENFGVPPEELEGRVEQALELTGIADLRSRSLNTLSGGQKQKVAIAAIVALRPQILLLDEPTGELDPQSSLQIFQMLRTLNEDYGITIVVVEQKIMLLCEFASKLMILQDGGVKFYDSVRSVLTHSRELEEAGVNCPRVVTLANALKEEGFYDGPLPINVDEAYHMMKEVRRRA